MSLGHNICVLRERQGWSMRELARRASILPGTMHHIESGKVDPMMGNVRKIRDALGATWDELLGAPLDDESHTVTLTSLEERIARLESKAAPAILHSMVFGSVRGPEAGGGA